MPSLRLRGQGADEDLPSGDNDPVVIFEDKLIYLGTRRPVPEIKRSTFIPFGEAAVLRTGLDFSLGRHLLEGGRFSLAARRCMLAKEGCSRGGPIDPRTIEPIEEDTILASVAQ